MGGGFPSFVTSGATIPTIVAIFIIPAPICLLFSIIRALSLVCSHFTKLIIIIIFAIATTMTIMIVVATATAIYEYVVRYLFLTLVLQLFRSQNFANEDFYQRMCRFCE